MTAPALEAHLADASVDREVFALRPDYVALLVAADGLPGGPSDEASDAWLREAEAAASVRLEGAAPEDPGPNALATSSAAADDVEQSQRVLDPAVATARRVFAAPHA